MSKQETLHKMPPQTGIKTLAIAVGLAFTLAAPIQAAEPTQKKVSTKPAAVKKTMPVDQAAAGGPIEFSSQISASVGKSTLLRLPSPAARVSVGNPDIADVIMLNPREIYLLGKKIGTTNLILWSKTGQSTIVDVAVGMDTASLQGKLQQMLPGEKNIKVYAAADSIVLSGSVSDAIKVDRAVALAEAFAGNKKVINMLSVSSVQQVMLEVKVAEINRTELDKLGINLTWTNAGNSVGFSGTTAAAVGSGVGTVVINSIDHITSLVNAQKKDELVKILAEPTIVSISGQEGSFLAGGEFYIPVPQGNGTITMESKQFGVGLRATPTVLDQGLINLRVQPEVTDLVGFTTITSTGAGGNTLVPTLTTRRVSTSVELRDGQSLAIGGLLQDTARGTINRFPVLGEIPVLGALFRSPEFQQSKTELLIIVTPRLVKPLAANYTLPTDAYKPPSFGELILKGQLEGTAESKAETAGTQAPQQQTPAPSGFQMK